MTALHWACMCSNVEVARLLLERGATKGLHGDYGSTEAYANRAARKEELLALLARY